MLSAGRTLATDQLKLEMLRLNEAYRARVFIVFVTYVSVFLRIVCLKVKFFQIYFFILYRQTNTTYYVFTYNHLCNRSSGLTPLGSQLTHPNGTYGEKNP